jgi:3-phenylpropionate/cinnamic acid dioxygenase small subunit
MSPSETEIRALLNAYCERLDAGDFDGVAELFRDGAFRSPRGTNLVGAEAVRSQYDPLIVYDDGTPRTKHVTTNLIIDADEDAGTATARSYFTVLQQLEGFALQPIIAGRYHDAFERVDGAWRLSERIIFCDLVGDLSRHLTTDPFAGTG